MDGVVLAPSEFSITRGDEPSMTATHELVVPRSTPMMSPASGPKADKKRAEDAVMREDATLLSEREAYESIVIYSEVGLESSYSVDDQYCSILCGRPPHILELKKVGRVRSGGSL